ncbi:MAG: TetR/AcrR family transcriptional regulator [Methylobacterium sp.]|nr:MAG: TetR/AcrR family transcriptional regulator [Methylobacterium sp.]
MESHVEGKSRGRPRCFDVERALDAAVCTFWKNGYEGTSLDDLTQAMGINRPSLYAAFGNKEQLFARAVARYAEQGLALMRDALAAPTAREAADRFLREVVIGDCDVRAGRGCMLVGAALTCSADAAAGAGPKILEKAGPPRVESREINPPPPRSRV